MLKQSICFSVVSLMLWGDVCEAVSSNPPVFLFEIKNNFQDLQGVAVSEDGKIAIVDGGKNSLEVFDKCGNYLFSQQDPQGNSIDVPTDIAFDTDGRMFVLDNFCGCIRVYDEFGRYLFDFADFTPEGTLPSGLEVNEWGEVVVTDLQANKVLIYDSCGNFLRTFGETGTGPGKFTELGPVAVNSDGNIYVTDVSRSEVQVFSRFGEFLFLFNVTPNFPKGIAVDEQGLIYVASQSNFIEIYDQCGNFILKFGESGSGPGQFNLLLRIAVSSDGMIYAADNQNQRVQVFSWN